MRLLVEQIHWGDNLGVHEKLPVDEIVCFSDRGSKVCIVFFPLLN